MKTVLAIMTPTPQPTNTDHNQLHICVLGPTEGEGVPPNQSMIGFELNGNKWMIPIADVFRALKKAGLQRAAEHFWEYEHTIQPRPTNLNDSSSQQWTR